MSGTQAKRKQLRDLLRVAMYIDGVWTDALSIDRFADQVLVSEDFPPNGKTNGGVRQFEEPYDLLNATACLQATEFPKISKTVVLDAMLYVARQHTFHPVLDYLNSLQWDGTPRLVHLFTRYFNAKIPASEEGADAYDQLVGFLERAGPCFLIGAVARVLQPGVKMDNVPVVLGEQDWNKSRAVAALCPDPRWFSDDLPPDVTSKDAKDLLTGRWIVELAEMPQRKRDVDHLKAFVTRGTDRYRRSYDRLTKDWPRTAVFIGTANLDFELRDTTGNRRFWVFEIAGPIDVATIERDRDQLWAEAVHRYRAQEKWWLEGALVKYAQAQQDAFSATDVWDSRIGDWLQANQQLDAFTTEQVFADVFGVTEFRQVSKAEQMRVADCLRRLGYRRKQSTVGSKRAWRWQQRSP